MAAKNNFKLMSGGKGQPSSAAKRKKDQGKRKGGRRLAARIAAVLLVVLGCSLFYVVSKYKVEDEGITVEGNLHYTREEIIDMVLTDRLSYNSLYLSLKYRNREIRNIPFIETMSVKVVSQDEITISVYEKSVAGCVEYMGRYMYFDRDGIVVESSETRTQGVPQVTGVSFDHVVLYEPLPVENSDIFQEILSITQMMAKYEITADKIYFNEDFEITLYFGGVKARLGKGDLEEKIMRLQYILPELEGESGVIQMENYTDESQKITFKKDGGGL